MKLFESNRHRHWAMMLVVSGLIWTFVPTTILIFIPIVIFWFFIALCVATVLMSWLHAWLEDR